MAFISLRTGTNTMETGLTIKSMVRALNIIMMEECMREHFKMGLKKASANRYTQNMQFMKENGHTISKKAMASSHSRMGTHTRECGRIMSHTEKEYLLASSLKGSKNMTDNLQWGLNMEEDCMCI